MSSPVSLQNMKPEESLFWFLSRVAPGWWEWCQVIFSVCNRGNQDSEWYSKIESVRIKSSKEKTKEPWLGRRNSLQVRWKMIYCRQKCHCIISRRDDVTKASLKGESRQHAWNERCVDLMCAGAGLRVPPLYTELFPFLPAANLCSSGAEGPFSHLLEKGGGHSIR